VVKRACMRVLTTENKRKKQNKISKKQEERDIKQNCFNKIKIERGN
jgi:hypothetical protein